MDIEYGIHDVAVEGHVTVVVESEILLRHQRRRISDIAVVDVEAACQATVAQGRHGIVESAVGLDLHAVFAVGRQIDPNRRTVLDGERCVKYHGHLRVCDAVGDNHGRGVGEVDKFDHIAGRLRRDGVCRVRYDIGDIGRRHDTQIGVDKQQAHVAMDAGVERDKRLAIDVSSLARPVGVDELHAVGLECEIELGRRQRRDVDGSVDIQRLVVDALDREAVEAHEIVDDRNTLGAERILRAGHIEQHRRTVEIDIAVEHGCVFLT